MISRLDLCLSEKKVPGCRGLREEFGGDIKNNLKKTLLKERKEKKKFAAPADQTFFAASGPFSLRVTGPAQLPAIVVISVIA